MTNNDRIAAIDPFRSVCLGGGWGAAVCVNPDGQESLWLVSPTPETDHGCACPDCAPHDQLTPWTAVNNTRTTETSR